MDLTDDTARLEDLRARCAASAYVDSKNMMRAGAVRDRILALPLVSDGSDLTQTKAEEFARTAARGITAGRADHTVFASPAAPLDMVLHCPACGLQHIDAPEESDPSTWTPERYGNWTNPPHRSHLCKGCGHVWRPADVPTNGVEAVKTKGKDDSPIVAPVAFVAPNVSAPAPIPGSTADAEHLRQPTSAAPPRL